MKKAKIISALTVSATALLIGGTVVSADVIEPDTPTTGVVRFIVDDGKGVLIEPDPAPGTDEEIVIPEKDGTSTSGAIRLQFVPNFDFGTHKGIDASATTRPVNLLSMNEPSGQPHGKGVIAPFVQVTDGRGLLAEKSGWTLTAVASKFAENNNPDNNLGESNMSFEGSTLTTTMGDTAKANEMVTGLEPGKNVISLDASEPTMIMQTKVGSSTSGYQVSNVFQKEYQKDMDYPAIGSGLINQQTSGVTFNKVANVTPLADVTYTSEIVWTLTTGL